MVEYNNATLYLADCKDILPTLPQVDAVVTDPPYGIGLVNTGALGNKNPKSRCFIKDKYGQAYGAIRFEAKDWNNKPIDPDLIQLVISKGKYVIVFGGNYYELPPSPCWLVWDKETDGSSFADAELAWTNLKMPVRIKRYLWRGMIRQNSEPRGDHPTQKPIGVMEWCIEQLPPEIETILDPFMGSATTGVAALRLGKKFIGIEREPDYFKTACKRIHAASLERRLFPAEATV